MNDLSSSRGPRALFWVALLALAFACAPSKPLDRLALKRAFMQSGAIELCIAAQADRAITQLGERLKREIEGQAAFSGELRLVAMEDPGSGGAMRICLGLAADARMLQLLAPLGVKALGGGGFSWRGLEHTAPSDALLACFPDPERAGLPMMVILGVEAQALARRSFSLPAPWIPRLQTWQGAGPAWMAELEPDGSVREASLRNFAASRRALGFERAPTLDGRVELHLGPGVDGKRLQLYLFECMPLRSKVEEGFGAAFDGKLGLWIYAHAEDMQRALGRAELSWLDAGSLSVHVLLAPGLPDDAGAGLASALALGLAGQPREAWMLDALGTGLTGRWWGQEASAWLEHLSNAGLRLDFRAATAPHADQLYSVHLLAPVRAWYLWNDLLGTGQELRGRLGALWQQSLERSPQAGTTLDPSEALGPYAEDSLSARRSALAQRTWRGVALYDAAPEGGGSAYATRDLESALSSAKQQGAGCYSLTIQVADDHPEAWLSASQGAVWSSASDAALASALAQGKALQMGSMLVLDPLLGVGQNRADLGPLSTSLGRREFLQRLRLFSLHYGLLGELLGLDILCLGTSLDQGASTLLGPKDAAKPAMLARKTELLAAWTEVIGRTHAAFGGALTYGAHFGTPLYQVGFWDRLDFVGLLGFGPQDPAGFRKASAGLADDTLKLEIERQLRKGMQFQEQVGIPPLFVQLGFPARDGAWEAWRSSRGAEDPGAQERFYRALALGVQDFDRRRKPANYFLWNWNVGSQPQPGALGDFSIRGRLPAETLGRLLRVQ